MSGIYLLAIFERCVYGRGGKMMGSGELVFMKTDLETMCRMDWTRGLCRETRYERGQERK